MNTMKLNHLESALECLENNKYGAGANMLSKTDESELQAEFERLDELLGNHSEMVGGKLGSVIGNYEDRLIDELARKISEERGDE